MNRPSRRQFLRGAGVSLALPFLPSLLGRSERAQASDLGDRPRYIAVFTPCGAYLDDWIPQGPAGRAWSLPPSLAPLAPYRDRMSVIRGLDATATASQFMGFHQREAASWLTCTPVAPTLDVRQIDNGWSTDQLLSDARYADFPWPSLQIGPPLAHYPEDPTRPFASVYQSAISWRGPTPLLGLSSHATVWRRLTGATSALSDRQLELERARGLSILDAVTFDLDSARARVSAADAQRLDAYLTGLRELERQLDAAPGSGSCAIATPPEGRDPFYADEVDTMFALAARLLACDLTRVATLMTCDAGYSRTFRSLGHTLTHHEYTHHNGVPSAIEATRQCDLAFTWVLRRLLDALAAEDDGQGGNLLDNTVVLYGSGMGDGSRHDLENVPMLTVGSAGGRFKEGELIDATHRPLADLHLAMLQGLGLDLDTFGDAQTPLDALRT